MRYVLTGKSCKWCGTPFYEGEFVSGSGCCRSCCEDKFAPPRDDDDGDDFDGDEDDRP